MNTHDMQIEYGQRARQHECPTCGSGAGKLCVNMLTGGGVVYAHRARLERAQRAAQKHTKHRRSVDGKTTTQ